jgi:hypothetical protein
MTIYFRGEPIQGVFDLSAKESPLGMRVRMTSDPLDSKRDKVEINDTPPYVVTGDQILCDDKCRNMDITWQPSLLERDI